MKTLDIVYLDVNLAYIDSGVAYIDLQLAADSLGDNEAYRSAVETELVRLYPDTVVTVSLVDTSTELSTSSWIHASPLACPGVIRDQIAEQVADQVRDIAHKFIKNN